MQYISFSISVTILSWIIGIIIGALIKKTPLYNKLSNLNIIRNESVNKIIGIAAFKWIIKNTFFKIFNPNLKLKGRPNFTQLVALRNEMTTAEINHLIAFACVAIFAVVILIKGKFLFALIMILVNILLNLYPSLLQQENKRQIDKVLKRLG